MSGSSFSRRPFRRVCELMRKAGAGSVLIHHNLECDRAFVRRYPRLRHHLRLLQREVTVEKVTQVTFFSKALEPGTRRLPPKTTARDILSTVVLVKIRERAKESEPRSFVYEAVVRIPYDGEPRPTNNYYHIFSKIQVCVLGRLFDLDASYFVQQDGITGVCAQATLQMGMFHVERKPPARGVERAVPIDKINNTISRKQAAEGYHGFNPREGLTIEEMQHVLSEFGLDAYVLDTSQSPPAHEYEPPNAYDFAYLLVESGIPTLLAFSPVGADSAVTPPLQSPLHVIHVVGHTSNFEEWLPMGIAFGGVDPTRAGSGDYLSSANWVPHLIVQDDLLGPYYCLGARDLSAMPRQLLDALRAGLRKLVMPISGVVPDAVLQLLQEETTRIQYVIGIVPSKDKSETLDPYRAEQISARYLRENWSDLVDQIAEPWKSRLKEISAPSHLVLRTQRVSLDAYRRHLRKATDHLAKPVPMSSRLSAELKSWPETFWMTEFSVPDLYTANRTKLGEVLIAFSPSNESMEAASKKQDVGLVLGYRLLDIAQTKPGLIIRSGIGTHIRHYVRGKLPALEY